MNTALLLTLLLDGDGEPSDVFAGPFRSVAGQAYSAGSVEGQAWNPGSVTGQSFTAGSEAGQTI